MCRSNMAIKSETAFPDRTYKALKFNGQTRYLLDHFLMRGVSRNLKEWSFKAAI